MPFDTIAKIAGLVTNPVATIATTAMTNRMKRKSADRAMAFERDMSNTAYRRGYADMRAAGINPILAGTQGGASTPTGKVADVVSPELTTALQASRLQSEIDLLDAQAANQTAQSVKQVTSAGSDLNGFAYKGKDKKSKKKDKNSKKKDKNSKKNNKSKKLWNHPKLNEYSAKGVMRNDKPLQSIPMNPLSGVRSLIKNLFK